MADKSAEEVLVQGLRDELARQARHMADLQLAVKARDEFLAIAAHELRNPMTPILGQIDILLTTARRAGSFCPQPIAAGLERLEQLIDSYIQRATALLDISRITSGKLHVHYRPVELSELILNCVRKHLPTFERAGCSVVQHLQSGVTAHLDALAVEQIVDNLLSNAAKYGAGAPVEIALSCNETTAQFSIRDHGIGISAGDQARIFDRFERVVSARNQSGGFGIGLWISRQLVEALHGDIIVDSRPGEGSTFEVILPRRPDKMSEAME
ncbi:MAG TPA: HAMP domain-containing sensor histidine kinase [Stellaceae bacterium]|nr:HAMP domain-containing sensor histidine kinase [Stellaceae bacterium]